MHCHSSLSLCVFVFSLSWLMEVARGTILPCIVGGDVLLVNNMQAVFLGMLRGLLHQQRLS